MFRRQFTLWGAFAACATAFFLLLVSLPSQAEASAQGPWVLPAGNVSKVGGDATGVQVATAPDGTTTAVWSRSDGANSIVQAATRPRGGVFEDPVNLSDPGQNAVTPQIAVGPDGVVTVVWARKSSDNSYVIQATSRVPGGAFKEPVDVSTPGGNASDPQIVVGPDGAVTVAWTRTAASVTVQASHRAPNESFSVPVNISAFLPILGGFSPRPSLATDQDGEVTVVWSQFSANTFSLQAATRSPGESFQAPENIATQISTQFPQVSIGKDGTTTAIWENSSGLVRVSTRPPGGSFQTPQTIGSGEGSLISSPQLAEADNGTTVAIWVRGNNGNPCVQIATRPKGGNFESPVDLSAFGGAVSYPQLTVASDGTTTAIWRRFNGKNHIIQSSTRPPGGTFYAIENLSLPGEDATSPQLASGFDGTVTAVWSRFDGANSIVQAASTESPRFGLSVVKGGAGGGRVVSSLSGVDCGSICSASFLEGTQVTLTATPDQGSVFTGWLGACSGSAPSCVVSMGEARSVTASFGVVTNSLSLAKTGSGHGRVVSGPAGIDCGPTCKAGFSYGARVTLTAIPVPGSTFSGWAGACSGSSLVCVVAMDQARNVSASFTKRAPKRGVAVFDGKSLTFWLKCPGKFRPACKGSATVFLGKGPKAVPVGVKSVSASQKAGKSKVVKVTVKKAFRKKVEALAKTPAIRGLVVKEKLKVKGKTKTVTFTYKVTTK